MGTKLLNQASSNTALEKLGETKDVESLKNALNNMFSEMDPSNAFTRNKIKQVLEKGKLLLSLIKDNIKDSKGSANFDADKMQCDLMDVQDIIFRIESIKIINPDQLKEMNELYHKHSKLQKLIKEQS
jgi:hypothetical protein